MSRRKLKRPKKGTKVVAREITKKLAPFENEERKELLNEMLDDLRDGPHGSNISEPLIRAIDGLNHMSDTIGNFQKSFRGQTSEEIMAGVRNYMKSDITSADRAAFLDSLIDHAEDIPNVPPLVPQLKAIRSKIDEIQDVNENIFRLKDHYEKAKREIQDDVNSMIDGGISDMDVRALLQSSDSSQMRQLVMSTLESRRSELPTSVQALLDVYHRLEGNDHALKEAMGVLEPMVQQSIIPSPNTAHNFEIGVMSLGRIEAKFEELDDETGNALVHLIRLSSKKNVKSYSLLSWYLENPIIPKFAYDWRKSGFSRVEVGHKLAAALCLTDAPAGVESPWETWSLVIPNGMFPVQETKEMKDWMEGKIRLKVERVWCSESRPIAVVGTVLNAINKTTGRQYMPVGPFEIDYLSEDFVRSMENLVRGVCLCISEKSEARSGDWTARPSGTGSKRKRGAPKAGELYKVGHAVQIDLREELKRHLSDGRGGGGKPKVQFLVRGHWRNQPYGKGKKFRRRQWIEPFWKGPEETRVLLRGYDVKEDNDNDDEEDD